MNERSQQSESRDDAFLQERPSQDLPAAAIVLRYDPAREAALHVAAQGAKPVADDILRVAQANHVPLREDPALIESLSVFDLNDQIPPELYRAVAEILTFLHRVETKKT